MKHLLFIALCAALMASCQKDNKQATTYQVNSTTSKAEWKGSAPDHFHVGAFKVTGDLIAEANGTIKEGSFVIPISSIEDYDLPEPVKQQLLDHLKSPDFFNMALHPDAKFQLKKTEPYSKGDTSAISGANYLLTGDFSMVGQTRSISFPAKISITADSLKAEATFKIDRTKWGMISYNDSTQGLYILPDINIHLKVKAAKKKS